MHDNVNMYIVYCVGIKPKMKTCENHRTAAPVGVLFFFSEHFSVSVCGDVILCAPISSDLRRRYPLY